MKACYILVLFSVMSMTASAQTNLVVDPASDLQARFDVAKTAAVIEDFQGKKCSTYSGSWQQPQFIVHTVDWTEGATTGQGPLYPANPGTKKSKTGLAHRELEVYLRDATAKNPESLMEKDSTLIWRGQNEQAKPILGYFRKDGDFLFYKIDEMRRRSNDYTTTYGYCFSEKF